MTFPDLTQKAGRAFKGATGAAAMQRRAAGDYCRLIPVCLLYSGFSGADVSL
jgi:hypothetical protein